ncbi:glycosyltransferase family 2 protein [Mycoplasma feriruminatoris]|uniref:Glycosyltransferase family 2 protein n=1 Tax=Mycoplasma feriruminatoris TaxID=1179777 RepID=A0AAQ3DLN9_9MOLU|nr:glycosyltransferase family 2 protein [Mycoplasma feriruminatoris]UKS53780.1 glycosyl transferase 2 family protein [Mycoplasma feriruminatoris]WFQ90698.1 glycosyltransferase family 2 protein [Mycoplasma feriruminatoris]WFQ94870.1 glycosyltransferase family 2 protein [Mycoplasma feriruminatoris]VZK64962.1 putative glycosyltransferase EpsJ [Mycoplasma feriruminatoris]VZR75105.1 putative glycosyltransferase EpsJ [Mycoplasma feriruminatoris]
MNKKLCTIIIPCYNMQNFLADCLDSIYQNIDCEKYLDVLIIDDGSTDNTVNIANNYLKKHKNISIYSKSNAHWGSVINYVKHNQLIKTKYAFILDADDKISKDFTDLLVNVVNKLDVDLGIFKTKILYKRKNSVIVNPKWLSKKQKTFLPMIIPCSTIFKTDIFYKSTDLIENVPYQDYVLYSWMYLHSTNVQFLPHTIGTYWFSRPNNTMSSAWNAKRIAGEKALLDELNKLNLGHLFLARIALPGYIKGLSSANIKLVFNRDKIDLLLKNASRLFKILFHIKFKKALKSNVIRITKAKTDIVSW